MCFSFAFVCTNVSPAPESASCTPLRPLSRSVWSVLEQLVQSLLHLREVGEAKATYEVLKRQFPKSTRVERLIGMIAEASGETSLAHDIFDSVLEKGSANRVRLARDGGTALGRRAKGPQAGCMMVRTGSCGSFVGRSW